MAAGVMHERTGFEGRVGAGFDTGADEALRASWAQEREMPGSANTREREHQRARTPESADARERRRQRAQTPESADARGRSAVSRDVVRRFAQSGVSRS